MKIGYARTSTVHQNLELQLEALKKYGCEKIFIDQESGSKESRKELDEMLSWIREGDTIICWKLDRLSRSLSHLLTLSELFNKKKVNLVSITDCIDTSTSTGKAVYGILGVMAQLERDLIRERVQAGINNAKAKGIKLGRPRRDFTQFEIENIKKRKTNGEKYKDIAQSLGVSYDLIYSKIIKKSK